MFIGQKTTWTTICELAGAFAATFVLTGVAIAKMPPPTEEQKAKAEEAKAKAAETAKKEAELLGKWQDRVTDRYIKEQKVKGNIVKPTPVVPLAATPAPAAGPAAPVAAAKAGEPAKK